jgi:hypothetical protein
MPFCIPPVYSQPRPTGAASIPSARGVATRSRNASPKRLRWLSPARTTSTCSRANPKQVPASGARGGWAPGALNRHAGIRARADRRLRGRVRRRGSLCYVNDLIEGLMRLLRPDCRLLVNLGNPYEVTTLQLAEILRDAGEHPSRHVHCLRTIRNAVSGYEPCGARVGLAAVMPLDDGLRRIVESAARATCRRSAARCLRSGNAHRASAPATLLSPSFWYTTIHPES